MSTDPPNINRGLIRDRISAIVAVVLTGFITAISFRAAFYGGPHYWHPFFHLAMLPRWTQLLINAAFYVYILWAFVGLFSIAKGRERFLVAGWGPGLLLDPIKGVVSSPAVTVIRQFQAVSIAVALLAAVSIFLETPARNNVPPESSDLK
jgi:hypothetical protein